MRTISMDFPYEGNVAAKGDVLTIKDKLKQTKSIC